LAVGKGNAFKAVIQFFKDHHFLGVESGVVNKAALLL
jgi:hypothetical protein